MEIPPTPGFVGYVQTPFRTSVRHRKISITFCVASSRNAVYNGRVDPANINPATFHLFFERLGDDLSAKDEYYRWWALGGGYILGSHDNTVVTIEAPLTSDQWIDVLGRRNDAEFNAALNKIGWVGISFGGTYYWGHGVNMLSGKATFELLDYRVE